MLLISAEKGLKKLQKKLSLLLDQLPSSVSAKHIHKLTHCADPDSWDGNIQYNNDSDELGEQDSCPTPEPVPIWPLIKTGTADQGHSHAHVTVHSVPWSLAELGKLQEKYSRHLEELETEYVMSLPYEGDRILLNKEEARGYLGPGVFLTTTPGNYTYALHTRAAYWAGGINPRERGDTLAVKTASFSDLAASVQKAASTQAVHERHVLRRSPMLAPIIITK